MLDIKNVLEFINGIIVIPIALITFFLLIYLVVYLRNKDPDVIRSKIFLKYHEFKKAFFLLAAFAFILVLHVSLIYIPQFFLIEEIPFIEDLQHFFGLTLALITITFAYYLYRSLQ